MRWLLFVLLAGQGVLGQVPPTDYRVWWGRTTEPTPRVVLRRWQEDGQPQYLLLDARSLTTQVVPGAGLGVVPLSYPALLDAVAGTAYGQGLAAERRRDGSLQDAGLERADTTEHGFSLTIDLCPSTKPLTRGVFEELIAAFGPEERPVPVTISITGLWMLEHPDDLAWLKSLVARGNLRVTWANHSFHHRFDPTRPLETNFLLEPGTSLDEEVLRTEQAMLANGLVPSVFFRFPGLVSDRSVFDGVLDFGLLPIGSDAWLAKGQVPRAGSLVLIHANGNEPLGIADFTRLVRDHSSAIRHKTWLLYDLPAGVSNER